MGSLQGQQVLSTSLLLHGFFFMGHSSHQEPSASWALCRLQHCGVLHGLQGNSLPHHNLHHRVQENVCASSYSTSSLSIYHGVSRAVSLPYSYSFLKCFCADFFLNLKKIFALTNVSPMPLMDSDLANWSWLKFSERGEAFGSFSHRLSPQPPHYQSLVM